MAKQFTTFQAVHKISPSWNYRPWGKKAWMWCSSTLPKSEETREQPRPATLKKLIHTWVPKMDGTFRSKAMNGGLVLWPKGTRLPSPNHTVLWISQTYLTFTMSPNPYATTILIAQTAKRRHKELKKPVLRQELVSWEPHFSASPLPSELTAPSQRLYTHRNVPRRARLWVLPRPALGVLGAGTHVGLMGTTAKLPEFYLPFLAGGSGGSWEEAKATAAPVSWCPSSLAEQTTQKVPNRLILQKTGILGLNAYLFVS